MGLLGPNGSGKTTILRILTGYLLPSSGTARIAGLDIVDDALAARARVGYVPEDVPLYGWMSVREFLAFMARLKGLAGRAAAGSVEAAIERLGLGDVRRMLIGKLSRGYRQRVAVAQALLGDPALLILDEPTNGLDPRQIIEMRGHIRALAGERTVLVTSHILGEIERVADRVAILLGGRLLGVHALGAGGSGQRIRMRVRGPEDAVRACLARVPGVQRVSVERPPGGDARDLLGGFRSGPRGGGAGRRRRRRRLRPARHGPGACRSGDALPRSHERPLGGARVRHFGTLLLKEEKAIFSSPIAYATVAVYLLLMGYTFTAVLFLNRTGELVRVFFQAAVLFLLIVPVVTMRLFAEERRAGTLELLLTSPVREIEIVLAKFAAGLSLPVLDARAHRQLRRSSWASTATPTGARSTAASSAFCSSRPR